MLCRGHEAGVSFTK